MVNPKQNIFIRKCSSIAEHELQEMYKLHATYFDNTSFNKFENDFKEKQWCIIIYNDDNCLKGYSTIQLIKRTINNKDVIVIFSGDTLVAKDYWQTNSLVIGFSSFLNYIQEIEPHLAKYWLLITKGYRTYRFLPVYYKKFYPAYNVVTPSNIKQIINTICNEKYGARYNSETGLVLSSHEGDYLNEDMNTIPEGKLRDPHVQYFLKQNPFYFKGNELACLTSISRTNIINPLFERYIQNYLIEIEK